MNSFIPSYDDFEDKRVVLLQSGGLDSNICASIFKKYGFEMHHLFVDYGQNTAKKELETVEKVVKHYGGTLHKVQIKADWLLENTLAKGDVDEADAHGTFNTIETGVYVPLRNMFLISLAGSLAEQLRIKYICTAIDGIEDCDGNPLGGTTDKHPSFAKAIENALNEGSAMKHIDHSKFTLLTPVMSLFKSDIVAIGQEYNADMSISWSCYNSYDKPCGHCSACTERKKGFEEAGVKDPLFEE